jgi:hypothetical protein
MDAGVTTASCSQLDATAYDKFAALIVALDLKFFFINRCMISLFEHLKNRRVLVAHIKQCCLFSSFRHRYKYIDSE